MIRHKEFFEDPYKELGVHGKENIEMLLEKFQPSFIDETKIDQLTIYQKLLNYLGNNFSKKKKEFDLHALKWISYQLHENEALADTIDVENLIYELEQEVSVIFVADLYNLFVKKENWIYKETIDVDLSNLDHRSTNMKEGCFFTNLRTGSKIDISTFCFLIAQQICNEIDKARYKIQLALVELGVDDWKEILEIDYLDEPEEDFIDRIRYLIL